jgi:hypothetical protein
MSARIGTVILRLQSFLLLTESAAESIEFVSKHDSIREAAGHFQEEKQQGKSKSCLTGQGTESFISNIT